MKLFTEEQVREAIALSMISFGRWLEQEKQITPGKLVVKQEEVMEQQLSNLTPIELPSEDNIRMQSLELSLTPASFQLGAKWAIEQIKEHNHLNPYSNEKTQIIP